MKLTRRAFTIGGAAMAAASTALPALAQSRGPVRLVVGFAPGGPADVIARALVEPMKTSLGSPVIVENRPGAGGRIAMDLLRTGPKDGSLLVVSPASIATMAPHLFKGVPYDLARDVLPLAPIARLDLGLYAGPAVPANLRTLPEVVKWLQDNPAKRSCGIPGAGSTPHLAAMLMGRLTKLDWQLIPYQGDAPAFLALLGGEIPVYSGSLAGGMEHLRAGKLRLLALPSGERSSFVPDVPTATQLGYDMVVEDRHTVFAPRQTPEVALAPVRQAVMQALAAPEMGEMLQRMSLQRSTPVSDFSGLMAAESERWSRAVKTLNLSMEG